MYKYRIDRRNIPVISQAQQQASLYGHTSCRVAIRNVAASLTTNQFSRKLPT